MKRILKRIAQAFVIVGCVVFAWYGQSRLFAPIRSVKIEHLSPYSEAAGEPSFLTLAAYNIAHGRGGKVGANNWTGRSTEQVMQHLSKIAGQVSEQKVDVLVLNEVDLDSSWSKSINQAMTIAEEAGLSWCASQRNFDVSFPFRRYCFGNAVLSRYPITDAKPIRLPAMSTKERLLAGNHDGLLVNVSTPLGEIAVLAVHLEYRSEDVRVECARIIKHLALSSPVPFVAMGDFNSAPGFAKGHQVTTEGHNAVDTLLESGPLKTGDPAVKDDYLTFPSANPDRAIDWILCSPSLIQSDARVVKSDLSDHLMVVGRVTTAE